MSGLELNKLIASILLASLIAMLCGTLVNILYKPELNPAKRGYHIEITDSTPTASLAEEAAVDIPAIMKTANAEAGRDVAKKCLACHSIGKGEPHKIGPNLWNIFGEKIGAREGYSFSSAMTAKEGVWNEENLFHFLRKPKAFVPGTKMSFVGLPKPQDIANVIAFLKILADH